MSIACGTSHGSYSSLSLSELTLSEVEPSLYVKMTTNDRDEVVDWMIATIWGIRRCRNQAGSGTRAVGNEKSLQRIVWGDLICCRMCQA